MTRIAAKFNIADGITPDIAAEIINHATKYAAKTELEFGEKRVVLGSLIGILSLELRQGMDVFIIADGEDETLAADEMKAFIEAM